MHLIFSFFPSLAYPTVPFNWSWPHVAWSLEMHLYSCKHSLIIASSLGRMIVLTTDPRETESVKSKFSNHRTSPNQLIVSAKTVSFLSFTYMRFLFNSLHSAIILGYLHFFVHYLFCSYSFLNNVQLWLCVRVPVNCFVFALVNSSRIVVILVLVLVNNCTACQSNDSCQKHLYAVPCVEEFESEAPNSTILLIETFVL